MNVLGIETSCDETATAIISIDGLDGFFNPDASKIKNQPLSPHINDQKSLSSVPAPFGYRPSYTLNLLSNLVASQVEEHKDYGGVVPEIAARAHITRLDHLISQSLKQAGLSFDEIDLISVTSGPGLIGGIMTGLMTAKAISLARNIPFIGINHLEGHALSVFLENPIRFPYLLLLVSGGHTQSLIVESPGCYVRLGSSVDDAAGEAFDKTAKLLKLGFPGGPALEKAAQKGQSDRFPLPRPFSHAPHANFSFSGLKTAVRNCYEALKNPTQKDIYDLAASAQSALVDCLTERSQKAMQLFHNLYFCDSTQLKNTEKPPSVRPGFVVAGGVASNKTLRQSLQELSQRQGFTFYAPSSVYCTDNAAMIALAGALQYQFSGASSFDLPVRARWPLDEETARIAPAIGYGRKGPRA